MKLMIVEDESIIRKGMIRSLDTNTLGLTDIIEAENGAKALALIRKHAPDIVLTDIRMPVMDGLSLGTVLQKDYPWIKLIYFSGYKEFDYALRAIELKAVDYLLKPVGEEELHRVIESTIGLLQETQSDRQSSDIRWRKPDKQTQKNLLEAVKKQDSTLIHTLIKHIFNGTGQGDRSLELAKYDAIEICLCIEQSQVHEPPLETQSIQYVPFILSQSSFNGLQTCMYDVFTQFSKSFGEQVSPDCRPAVQRTIAYINDHYHENITLDVLAKNAFVTASYLSKLFKDETGYSIVKWVNKLRIAKAKEYMVSEPAWPIYKIADEVGFKDYKYFSRVFHQHTGFSPIDFKKQLNRHEDTRR